MNNISFCLPGMLINEAFDSVIMFMLLVVFRRLRLDLLYVINIIKRHPNQCYSTGCDQGGDALAVTFPRNISGKLAGLQSSIIVFSFTLWVYCKRYKGQQAFLRNYRFRLEKGCFTVVPVHNRFSIHSIHMG